METTFHITLMLLPVLFTLLVVAYVRIFLGRGERGLGRLSRPLLLMESLKFS